MIAKTVVGSLIVKCYSYIRISPSVDCLCKGIDYVLKMTSAFAPNMKPSLVVNIMTSKNE
jgi:hypothetical protein